MATGITTNGVEFFVDDEDAFLLKINWVAGFCRNGKLMSIQTRLKGSDGKYRTYRLHRTILKQPRGNCLVVDHIDGDPANNCRSNLRVCTHGENARNQSRSMDNTSGFKGVSWHKQSKKWRAYITVNYKRIHLGLFDTPEAAHEAYARAAEQYHGEFARMS